MARGTTTGNSVRHARRRALFALALFALGTLMATHVASRFHASIELYLLGGAALGVAVGVLGPVRTRTPLIACSVLLLGMAWAQLRSDQHRPDRVNTIVGEIDTKTARVPIEVRGVVRESSRVVMRRRGLADPPMWPERSNHALLRVESVLLHEPGGRQRWRDASGDVRLVLATDHALHAGDRVELLGLFSEPTSKRNPGDPEWSALAAQRGLAGTLVVDQAAHVRQLERGGLLERARGGWWSLRATLRDRALASIGAHDSTLSDDATGMRAALLLGQRETSFDDVFGQFQRVGVAHVLAISGFHLALVVLMLALSVRLLGEHPRLEALVVIIALAGVVTLIPLRPPIVRAAVIVGAMLLATRIGRRYDRMTILAWVGLGLLIWRPLDASSMGYQLSMGITALLVALNDRGHRMLVERQSGVQGMDKPSGLGVRVLLRVWSLLKLNFACWAVALPVVMYHAGVVGVLAPIVAVVIVPLIVVLMALGYVQILIGIVSPELAQQTMWLVDVPSDWTLALVSWFDGLGFAWVRVPAMSVWWACGATLVVALFVTGRVRWRRPLGVALLLVVIGLGVAQPALLRPRVALRVVMLDVGDGSCVVLQSGNRGLLWDCGSLDRRVGDSVARSLRRMGITRLDGVVVTHDNLDHYNGLPELAEHMPIRSVYITDRLDSRPSDAWSRVRDDLEDRGLRIEAVGRGDRLSVGGHAMQILWPSADANETFDENDTSLVALIEIPGGKHGGGAVLLTGDIEGPAMEQIRISDPALPSLLAHGVIELPHHGSARDKAYGFIDWLDPGVIMQSTGPSRIDDERWDTQRHARAWYTTAKRGAIVIEFDPEGTITHGYWFEE